jgi:hypothetical protein
MDQHRYREPPIPSSVIPSLAPFDFAVRCALAKAPDDRFASMEELIAALPVGRHVQPAQVPATDDRVQPTPVPVHTTTLTAATGAVVEGPRKRMPFSVGPLRIVGAIAIGGVGLVIGAYLAHRNGGTEASSASDGNRSGPGRSADHEGPMPPPPRKRVTHVEFRAAPYHDAP